MTQVKPVQRNSCDAVSWGRWSPCISVEKLVHCCVQHRRMGAPVEAHGIVFALFVLYLTGESWADGRQSHYCGPGGGQLTSAGSVMDPVPGRSNKPSLGRSLSGTLVLQSDATGLLLIKNFIQILNLCTLVLVYLSGGWKVRAQMTASNDCSDSSPQCCKKTANFFFP